MKLIAIGRKGPAFREPRSLVDTLKASVDYNAEAARQRDAIRIKRESGPLPTNAQLALVHDDLSVLVGASRWVPA